MKDNACGILCKIGVVVWTGVCVYWAGSALFGIVENAREAGVFEGFATKLASEAFAYQLGQWAALRLVPLGAAAVFYFMFGRSTAPAEAIRKPKDEPSDDTEKAQNAFQFDKKRFHVG